MPKTKNALSPKEQMAVDHYLLYGNMAEAIRAAGYTCKNPNHYGFRMFRKPRIAAIIEAHRKEQAKKSRLTADRVREEIADVAYMPKETAIANKVLDAKVRAMALATKVLGLEAPNKVALTSPTGEALPVSYVFVGDGRMQPPKGGDGQ